MHVLAARVDRPEWEAANLHTLATALTAAAALRRESRGGHVRRDLPAQDAAWRRHVLVRVDASGELLVGASDLLPEQGRV